uniref:Activin_recp domain-containing protein n=1 Tax=Heterorhabditis bacteriophora TaxID=37862 RepID=A0A1I7WMZ3_HETBA
MNPTAVFSFIFLFTFNMMTHSLRCYEGSKGEINGQSISNFVANQCEEDMIHCFESYSDDKKDVTAGCQTPNTDLNLLDVCKKGCVNHENIHVTVCCCDTDLCNLPPDEVPTPSTTSHPKAIHRDMKLINVF